MRKSVSTFLSFAKSFGIVHSALFLAIPATIALILIGGCSDQSQTQGDEQGAQGETYKIPGKIEAENYHAAVDLTKGDIGDRCIKTRNKDVDVLSVRDDGGGCGIGWTQTGEHVDYWVTHNESSDKTFDLSLRVSSADPRGEFDVESPLGKVVGKVKTYSGGWQNWFTAKIKSVKFPPGRQVIRIRFKGENNLNHFSVAKTSSSVVEKPKQSWNRANLTHFTSYPEAGSDECLNYNGCLWEGMFAAINGKQSREWVASTNIVAVHGKDFAKYKLKTLRIRSGGKAVDAKVYDMCADSDCNGCCTENSKETGFLIDLEDHTAARLGERGGQVDWMCLDCE